MNPLKRALLAGALIAASGAAPAAQRIDIDIQQYRWNNPALRIGQNYTLKATDAAREVLVVAGDATIEGRVDREVVVIFGKVQVASTAVIDGSLIVFGGSATVAEGAQVREDLFVLGGYEAAPGFNPSGHQVVIGTESLGGNLRAIVPWLTRGLLWGRPIVPGLPWVWTIALVFFLVNLLLNTVFDTPVRAAATTLRATPMTSFMTGLLVMLLFGPVCFILGISIVGLAVVPFLLAALLIATAIGKVGFARWIGMSVVRQEEPENRFQSLRSFAIGSAIMCIAYMIPLLGFVAWGMAGLLGLGASTLAFFAAYRRENPKPPKKSKTPVVTPDAPPPALAPEGPPPAPVALSAPISAPISEEPLYAAIPQPVETPPVEPPSRLVMMPRAAFLERLAAFALDVILVIILANIFDFDRYGRDWPGTAILIALMYHVGFWTWKGTTLGGIICQLRIVRVDGAVVKFAEALVRGLTGMFSLAVAGLGFLWILRDPERQAWHDRVAGTYVVKVPRDWPI
jgi:uncharacterized RDD family membrane protein YckC